MPQYTLKQASALLQSKQISAVELAGEYLKAIAAHNPALNAYITLDEEKTLAEARAREWGDVGAQGGRPELLGSAIGRLAGRVWVGSASVRHSSSK